MSAFTPAEIEFLQGQQLGRIATVGKDGQPHVVPTGILLNASLDTVDIGGHQLGQSKKFAMSVARGARRSWWMTCYRRGIRAGPRSGDGRTPSSQAELR